MAKLTAEMTERLLNEFALRSFRDVADGDYIAARLAYRADLLMQAFWASQQALEKYLKGILLFRRIPGPNRTHSITRLLKRLEDKFAIDLSVGAREFMAFIDQWDVDRYFTFPYGTDGDELFNLDETVWELRRYCSPVDRRVTPGGTPVDELELRHIEAAREFPPQVFHPKVPGLIERVIHAGGPAQKALTWKNLYFGKSKRKSIKHSLKMVSHNSPLSLNPEIIDEVKKYVYLPDSANSLKR